MPNRKVVVRYVLDASGYRILKSRPKKKPKGDGKA